MIKPNPLLDEVFLQKLYTNRHKEIYAKIIALDKEENPIEQIEGQVTGGSVSLDGSSNVRRSCSLTMVTHNIDINAYYWGFKNKFKLYIGLNNTIEPKYDDIIWFPFGVMVITNFNTSRSANGYNISINGKDKMCLINGELSGSLFASVDFGKEEYYDIETGVTTITDIPIKQIVREAIHEYAGEPWENIVINDLEDYGLELLDYKGNKPLYLLIAESGSNEDLGDVIQIGIDGNQKLDNILKDKDGKYVYTLDELSGKIYTKDPEQTSTLISAVTRYNPRVNLDFSDADVGDYDLFYYGDTVVSVAKVEYGQTCGYRYTDITYAGDLILSVGEPVTAMLDKLVTMLGNWEYFYDVDGRFIFQRKKTYLDKTWNTIVTDNDDSYIPTIGETYVESALWSSAVSWNFTDSFLVTAFNNTPVLNNVRNDYSIWGTKQSINGTELPVHLRYAIDKKPSYYKSFDGSIYMTSEEAQRRREHGVAVSDPFHSHLVQGMNYKWWDINDWARRYLYIVDTENNHDLSYYLSLTPQEVVSILDSADSSNPYLRAIMNQKLNNFWTEYVPVEKVLNIFTDERSANVTRNYEYLFLFDTKVDENGQEYIAYVSHNSSNIANINYKPSSCSHTYKELLRDAISRGYAHSYFYAPSFPETSKNVDTQETLDYLNALDNAIICDWREIIFQMAKDYRKYGHYTPYDESDGKEHQFTNKELFNFAENFSTYIRENNGKNLDGGWYYPTGKTGYEQYYTDLEGFWRQLYCPPQLLETYYNTGVWTDREWAQYKREDNNYAISAPEKTNILYFLSTNWVANGDADGSGWNTEVVDSPATINFWFDFLDADENSDFAKYSVPVIGDRAKSVNDNMVKAIYFREVPNTIFTENRNEIEHKSGYTYMQYQESMSGLFNISSQGKSSIDVMEEWLNNYVYAVESVSMTTVPVYHLQPNTRVKIMDMDSKINGDYIVSRISVPLTYNGTMSITATKIADRVY